jgi:hypothetical protein
MSIWLIFSQEQQDHNSCSFSIRKQFMLITRILHQIKLRFCKTNKHLVVENCVYNLTPRKKNNNNNNNILRNDPKELQHFWKGILFGPYFSVWSLSIQLFGEHTRGWNVWNKYDGEGPGVMPNLGKHCKEDSNSIANHGG